MKKKSKGVAYALWLFLGLFGGHRFYLGHIGVGVLQLLTVGGFGIWWIIDAFALNNIINKINRSYIGYGRNINNNNNNNVNNVVVNVSAVDVVRDEGSK